MSTVLPTIRVAVIVMTIVALARTHDVRFLNVSIIVANMDSCWPLRNQCYRVRETFDSDQYPFLYAIDVSAVDHALMLQVQLNL